MTDGELEEISKSGVFSNGRSIWATWESERTSFGKTFRKLIHYPSFLPLFFSSDHYVDMLTSYRSNEAEPTYPLYFTWNENKCQILRDKYHVNAVHIEHPWMAYRRKRFPEHSVSGEGTLIFWPHSHGNLKVEIDLGVVKNYLENIPMQFHPIAICVSSLDIDMGIHNKLRQLGYPIYSAGNILSQSFVDRFYTLLNNFRYAGGFYLGSHIYYCLEFGIPYIAMDYTLVTLESKGIAEIPDGIYDFISKDYPDIAQREIFDSWYASLKNYSTTVTVEQMEFARRNLGSFSTTTIREIRILAYRELFRNAFKIPKLYYDYFKKKFGYSSRTAVVGKV